MRKGRATLGLAMLVLVMSGFPEARARQGARGLAEKQGLTLTEEDVQTGVSLIQFVVGQRIKPSEVKEARQQSIKEFLESPQAFVQGVGSIRQSLQKLQSLTDPLHVGAARQQLIAQFHRGTRQMPEAAKPLLIRIINRYVNVLAFDEATGLALTDRDASAAIDYLLFAYELAGTKVVLSRKQREEAIRQMVEGLSALPLAERQFLCSASLAWTVIQANWRRLTPAQKRQIKASYAQRPAPAAAAGQQGAGAPQGNAGGRKTMAQMARDFRARQNMFRMMYNTSLGTHATMMNTIENFGGTGNYWKVGP